MMRIVLFIVFCVFFNSCKTTSEPQSVGNFPANVSIIIQNNCMGGNCHTGATTLNTQVDLTSWDAMTRGSIYFNEIIPYTAAFSHFFGHLNNNPDIAPVVTPSMPLGRDYLSTADQLTFFNWINQGAKSADGKIPYSDVAQKIFVVGKNANMISVIDAGTQRWVRVISTGDQSAPSAIAMMPDKQTFIGAMTGGNGIIQKYDVATYTAIGQFSSNINAGEIAITPDGSKGYITDDNANGNKFIVFDPVTMKLDKTVSSPFLIDPYSVTVSPDGKYAYICGAASDNVVCIDTKNDSIVKSLQLGGHLPRKIVISGDSKTMYVSCYNTSEIVVFDLTKDSIIARIPVLYNPYGLALTPDGSELWTTTYGDSTIRIISTATNQIIARIDSVSLHPDAIAITPDGNYAYISCDLSAGGAHHHATGGLPASSYVVIDRRTRRILSIYELPPLSVAVTMGYK